MTDSTTLSGKISIQTVAKGSRSERNIPVLTLEDGTIVIIERMNGNPFLDEDLNEAVNRIVNEAGGTVTDLKGVRHRSTFIIEDTNDLLRAAGLGPEQAEISAPAPATLSGTVSIELISQGTWDKKELFLTTEDGTKLHLDIPRPRRFPAVLEVLSAAGRIVAETDGKIENLEGTIADGTFYIKDAAALLQSAGLGPEQAEISSPAAPATLSGTLRIEQIEFTEGAVLTTEDGRKLQLDIPYRDHTEYLKLQEAAARVEKETDAVLSNLAGTIVDDTFYIKDAAALLKSAGLEPEKQAGRGR